MFDIGWLLCVCVFFFFNFKFVVVGGVWEFCGSFFLVTLCVIVGWGGLGGSIAIINSKGVIENVLSHLCMFNEFRS